VANIDESAGYSVVLNLIEEEQEFVFGDVKEKPLPSLLRDFSAPVKLNYAYSRDDLTFLMSNDSDGFNRWEASNRLGTEVLEEMTAQIVSEMEVRIDERLIKAAGHNLQLALDNNGGTAFDKAMLANMLVLPSEAYLIECSSVANVEAIYLARKTLQKELAFRYKEFFLSVYEQNEIHTSYSPDSNDVSRRMLRNLALHYLVCTEEQEFIDLCLLQFNSANNMTDVGASLKELVFSGSSYAIDVKNKALALFYDRWKSEPLVVDQWFAVQASCPLEGALDQVKALTNHDAFDIKIPNRVRSLIGQFSSANLLNFHKESGEGYEFLADRVIELNSINPQTAARAMIPLTRWKKFGDGRQKKMKGELNRILNIEKISPDVYEIATKSL
jgi:aminopeptidase N